jgi:hypothetical protein
VELRVGPVGRTREKHKLPIDSFGRFGHLGKCNHRHACEGIMRAKQRVQGIRYDLSGLESRGF